MPLIIIALLIGLPMVLAFILRVNAAILFLALCTGSVLSQFVSKDAYELFDSFFPRSGDIASSVVQLLLLLLPAALTILFMRRSISASKSLINLLPAAASGLLTALLAVPLFAPGTSHNIMASNVWSVLQQSQTLIIGVGAFISLLVLWGTKPKHDKKGKHK